jgi:hypothetical protein
MEHTIRVRALGTAAVIGLGVVTSIVTSTIVVARAYESRPREAARTRQEITVKGSARMAARADLGVWRIGVSGEGTDLKVAYEVLEFGVDRVTAFLQQQGFAESSFQLGAIDTDVHTQRDKDGRETGTIRAFSLSRSFTITSAEVERLAKAASDVTQLLRENVRVTSRSPEFTCTKVGDFKVQILGLAARDALIRAQEIAKEAGCRVGEVRQAQMGVMQITQPHSTGVSNYGVYDTCTIDKEVSVVVTTTFAIEPP